MAAIHETEVMRPNSLFMDLYESIESMLLEQWKFQVSVRVS